MKAFIVFAFAFLAVASARRGKPEYHWRDFNGTVPRDALKVVPKNSDSPVVYVGQGYFPGHGLLPGMITDGVMQLQAVASGHILNVTSNIQIMATDSKHPETDFQWISIDFDHLDSLRSLEFLKVPPGGTETKSVVYIGRHSEADYINLGKIYTIAPWQGLTIPDKNGKITVYKNFEVLAMLNFDCLDDEQHHSSEDSNENSSRITSPTRRFSDHLYNVRS